MIPLLGAQCNACLLTEAKVISPMIYDNGRSLTIRTS